MSAATTDTERLDWMSEHQARIGWNREGESCRVWKDEGGEDGPYPVCGWERFFDTPREAIDAAMKVEP